MSENQERLKIQMRKKIMEVQHLDLDEEGKIDLESTPLHSRGDTSSSETWKKEEKIHVGANKMNWSWQGGEGSTQYSNVEFLKPSEL